MNHTTPVNAVQLPGDRILDKDTPGAFLINEKGTFILCVCPCGCGNLMNLPITLPPKQERAWEWDGNRESPTLAPSIRDLAHCKFHGHLRSGVWTFEGDSGK